MTSSRSARRRSRKLQDARSLPPAEWERIVREKSYIRPLPPIVPLHRMAGARVAAAQGEDSPGDDAALH